MAPAFLPFPTKPALEDLENGKGKEKQQEEYREDLAVRLLCPNCRDPVPNIVEEYSSGDLICGDCGLVLGDRVVDTRSEWRTFSNDEGGADPSRVGGATNSFLGETGDFSTVVGDAKGSGISRELQKAAQRTNSSANLAALNAGSNGNGVGLGPGRNLASAFTEIDQMCDIISLPTTVRDVAKQLFKRADEERVLRGKPTNAIVGACIFIACRQAGPGVARSFKEIYTLTGIPKKVLGQCFKVLKLTFVTDNNHYARAAGIGAGSGTGVNGVSGSHVNGHDERDASPHSTGGSMHSSHLNRSSSGSPPDNAVTGAEDMMARFCNHLGIPVPIQIKSIDVARSISRLGLLDGRSPMTLAGAAIYFTSHLFDKPKTVREIASVSGISENTVRLGYKFLYGSKEKLVDQAWLKNGQAKLERLPTS